MASFENKLIFARTAVMGAFFGLAVVGAMAWTFDWPERETWDLIGGVAGATTAAVFKFLHIV